MDTTPRRLLLDLVACASLGLSVVLALSPFAFYWLVHGDDDRYIWLISGPEPFDTFGSGPFQLWVMVGLTCGAFFFFVTGLSLRLRLLGLRQGWPVLEAIVCLPTALLFLAALSLLFG